MRRKRNIGAGLKPLPVTLPKPEDAPTRHSTVGIQITITSIPCEYTVGGHPMPMGWDGNRRRRDCSNPGCIERNACVRALSALQDQQRTGRAITPATVNCYLCNDAGIVAHVPGQATYCPAVGCDARNHVLIEYTTNNTQRIVRQHNINAPNTLGGAFARANSALASFVDTLSEREDSEEDDLYD